LNKKLPFSKFTARVHKKFNFFPLSKSRLKYIESSFFGKSAAAKASLQNYTVKKISLKYIDFTLWLYFERNIPIKQKSSK